MKRQENTFFEEDKWAMEHYQELQEKYPDQWVVIKGQHVVKHGKDISQESDEYSIFVGSCAEIF